MIESSIINWLDIGDSMQNLDVFDHKKTIHFFNLFRVLVGYKNFSLFIFVILRIFFFLQILMISLVNTSQENDSTVKIFKYVKIVILVHENINSRNTYIAAIIIITAILILLIACMIFLSISISFGKFITKAPVHLFNIINIILINYLIGPIIQVCVMSLSCTNGVHKFLGDKCFGNWLHILIFVLSILFFIFYVGISVILSIYYNEIGSINSDKVCARINCNYEFYINISKIVLFIFSYCVDSASNAHNTFAIIFEIFLFVNCLGFAIYTYREVYYYEEVMNKVELYGWVFSAWFSLVIVLKTLLNITDTSIFHIIGWILLAFIIHFMEDSRREYLLSDFNVFEATTLKEIELFSTSLFNLINMRSVKAKTLLIGITEKFADYAKTNPDTYETFSKLSMNDHLKKQFNSNSALPILSIIYIVYEHHLEKPQLKNDILLNLCYFLINKFKNPTYAVNLLSKYKVVEHKHLYFKFVLLEEIKEYYITRLSKVSKKENINQIEISSVILYYIYMELLKIKIYDAACSQVEYFDTLKNTMCTPKTTEAFLKQGEDILKFRKEILNIWEKLLGLNPFSDECERDYMLYLNNILQDDILARSESKKYVTLKNNQLTERNNLYHSMFIKDTSSILLVDGYSSNGKILYSTPFPSCFNFSGKEILNMCINDLIPGVVAQFHSELIDNAVKYSNLTFVFKKQKDFLLKGKSGGIFSIKLYTKCMPNLVYGLIYIVQLSKCDDHNFIIVVDKDFKINGITDMISTGNVAYTISNNYGLSQGLCGHHIGLVLPELLLQLEYKNKEFILRKTDVDIKGNLYPVSAWKDLDVKVNEVVEKIKLHGKLDEENNNNMNRENGLADYESLTKELNTRYTKSFSVFYRIILKSFLDNKFKYYRIYITNDLVALNENNSRLSNIISKPKRGLTNDKVDNNINNINEEPELSNAEKSDRQIRLKFKESDNKLIDEKKNDENNNNKDNHIIGEKQQKDKAKNSNSHLKENIEINKKPSQAPSSLYTKSSIDSATFNKLKNGILEKREISTVRVMKYICVLFIIVTITLIIINSNTLENNFEDLRDYLQQNLFFNHSKISVSCIYLSVLNLKWVKDGYIKEKSCDLAANCSVFYSSLLMDCIEDIKAQKENSSYFYDDFKSIFNFIKEIEIDVYNLTTKDKLSIDIDNLINILISNGLKLNNNLDEYYKGENIYDVCSLNILDQSLDYIDDQAVVGFNDVQKEKKVQEHFTPLLIPLIIECIFIVIIFGVFTWMIYNLNQMENYYLDKLIKFHSNNFENYLKSLEDLKKKLRNDNGDDDDNMNDDLEGGEGSSKKSKKDNKDTKDNDKNDAEKNKHKKGKNKNNDEDENIKHKDSDDSDNNENDKKDAIKKRKKQRGNKANKIHQQRVMKKKVMSKYFFKWNVILILKILFLLLISFSYYILVELLEKSKKNDYLEFDGNTDSIEGVYKNSFDIFISLKVELAKFENYEVEKSDAMEQLIKGDIENVTIGGIYYTQENSSLLETAVAYKMTLPSNNEITTPKLGNLLMPLVNDLNGASDATKELNNLYNNDACLVLFQSTDTVGYKSCSTFWSSIIVKGIEQSIIEMGDIINSVLDELNSLNIAKKLFRDVVGTSSTFSQYEIYIEYYLFYSYMKSVDLFYSLKEVKINSIYHIFRIILYCYVIGAILIFLMLLYMVRSSKIMFNSFLNFIGIIPIKFLIEDDGLYKDVLRLEHHIF